MSPEYLFHSASTEADGSSEAGRCPKMLLKKLLDIVPLAQGTIARRRVHTNAGSIVTCYIQKETSSIHHPIYTQSHASALPSCKVECEHRPDLQEFTGCCGALASRYFMSSPQECSCDLATCCI